MRSVWTSARPSGYLVGYDRAILGWARKIPDGFAFKPMDSCYLMEYREARTMEDLRKQLNTDYDHARRAEILKMEDLRLRREAADQDVPSYCPAEILAMPLTWYVDFEREPK